MRADRSRLPEVGPDPSFTFPALGPGRLENGMTVRTVEHHSVPVVTFVFQIADGSGADPTKHHGLAAIVADLLDEGSGMRSAIDISDALARIGAEFDVDVTPDATALTLTTLARFADRGAQLLADMVIRPSLRIDDFERVRQLRLDRLRQMRDMPPAVADRAFVRLIYREHPYGHMALGNESALRALTLDDIRAFHAAAYQPSRATLIVCGALSQANLHAVAQRAFGSWLDLGVAPPSNAAVLVQPPLVPVNRLAIVPRENAPQSELRIGHVSASRTTPDYHALLVMNAALGGQFVSRINLKLREEKGYTYGARTGFDWHKGLSPFALQVSVHSAATVDAIHDALSELTAIRGARPIDAREMMLAKASLTRGYPRNFETAQQVARSVSQLALYNLEDTYFEEFVPRVNSVDADEVTRVACNYLDPSRLVTLIVGDYQAIAASLGSLHLGEPLVLSPDA
jgi:zinc protease